MKFKAPGPKQKFYCDRFYKNTTDTFKQTLVESSKTGAEQQTDLKSDIAASFTTLLGDTGLSGVKCSYDSSKNNFQITAPTVTKPTINPILTDQYLTPDKF